MIKCSVCGFVYDATASRACGSCPLHGDCTVSCCPNCGVSDIQPEKSKTARWLLGLIKGVRNASQTSKSRKIPSKM